MRNGAGRVPNNTAQVSGNGPEGPGWECLSYKCRSPGPYVDVTRGQPLLSLSGQVIVDLRVLYLSGIWDEVIRKDLHAPTFPRRKLAGVPPRAGCLTVSTVLRPSRQGSVVAVPGYVPTRMGWGTGASPVLHKDRLYVVHDNADIGYVEDVLYLYSSVPSHLLEPCCPPARARIREGPAERMEPAGPWP